MAIQPGVWGIDLGQCGLKAIRIEEQEGKLVATAFDYVEHPKILSQPDADPDQLTREALEKFLSRNQLRGDIIAISVPGQSGLARFVKLPPVEEKKIGDIVRFEAKQQIPFNLEEVVWAYQKLGSGVVTDGFAMETEIALFAMKRDMINRYLQHFRDVKVEVHLVQMAPLALCNFVAYDLLGKNPGQDEPGAGGGPGSKKKCIVALDVGTDSSNLVITDGGRIIWQRPIPLGGNHFTRALTKEMKLTFAKAEHLKRNATKSPDLKQILSALKPVLNDFVGEVQRSLGYFTNTHRDAQIDYMVGLGNAFRLPGLQKYMAEKLGLDVRKLGKLERLQGDAVVNAPVFTENLLSFAVAYGLAVQGMKQGRLTTDLLPQEIRLERLIRAKKPWAAAAAAALLFGVGMTLAGVAAGWRPFAGGTVKEAMKDTDGKYTFVSGEAKKYTDTVAGAKDEEKGFDSIIAGQNERFNWPLLDKFIGELPPRPEDILPGPDGKNNLPEEAQAYLDMKTNKDMAQSMRDALDEWQKRQKSGKGLAESFEGLDYLVQFNITGFDCRYSDNLGDFWNKLPREVTKAEYRVNGDFDEKDKDKQPKTERFKAPEATEKGWVVELRGYTFHQQSENFIRNTLMPRIVSQGAAWEPKIPTPAGVTPVDASGEAKPAVERPRLVSHVVLRDVKSSMASVRAGDFKLITASALTADLGGGAGSGRDALSGPGGPGKGGGRGTGGPAGGYAAMNMSSSDGMGSSSPGGMGGAAPSPGRSAWSSLLGGASAGGSVRGSGGIASSAAGTAGMGGAGTRGVMSPGGGGKGGGVVTDGTPDSTDTPASTSSDPNEKTYKRTEFIIYFIWRESTPSESLLQAEEAPASGDPSMGGFPGGMGTGR